MPELLNKADVMRVINEENAVVLCCTRLRSVDEVLCSIVSRINSLQTIQTTIEAEPVRHGRWILCKDQYNVDNDNGNYAYYCSCCKHQDIHAESAKVSFCWNCGADMREEGADNG